MIVRIGTLALVVVLGLAASGCGGSTDDTPPAPTTTATAETTETATEDTAPEDTVETTTASEVVGEPDATFRVVVRGGQVTGGIQRPVVHKGDDVLLVIDASGGEYVHLHGYDVQKTVVPGKPARIRFKATIPGRFEVELHNPSVVIAEVEVRP